MPYAGLDKVNLLRTFDIPLGDQAKLMNRQMGDLLHHPSSQILSSAIVKESIDMKSEMDPQFKASRFSVHFTSFKTPTSGIEATQLPTQFVFKYRFFTFEEEVTKPMQLMADSYVDEGKAVINAGVAYYLRKVNTSFTSNMANRENIADQLSRTTFSVDPSASGIDDQHVMFAKYLKDRYLTVDIFDGVSQFYFGSCKIPLYDLLRQGKQMVVRPKECEIFNPENSKYLGFL